MKSRTLAVLLLTCSLCLLMGCAAASASQAPQNAEPQITEPGETKKAISLTELWNGEKEEFSLPGLPMDSSGEEVKGYFKMDHVPIYTGRDTVESGMLAVISIEGQQFTAIMDTQWRDNSLFMESLNCDLTQNESLDAVAEPLVSELTTLYGTPAASTFQEQDGGTTQEYIWRKGSTDGMDSRLSLWITSKDNTVSVIQLSCDKPKHN